MLFFGTKSFLGVDIGTASIKVVELEKDKERFVLKNYGIWQSPDYLKRLKESLSSLSGKTVENEVADILKQIAKKAGFKSREANVSIPVFSSFSTVMELPEMSEEELEAAVNNEAKHYIPVPIEEVVLDWSLVTPSKEETLLPEATKKIEDIGVSRESSFPQSSSSPFPQSPSSSEEGLSSSPERNVQVLIVAVPKEVINKQANIIKLAGLNLKTLEAETFSIARAFLGNDRSATLLIDMGARSTNLSIVDNGFVRVANHFGISGGALTEAISQGEKVSLEEAEKLKQKISGLAGDETSVISFISPLLNKIVLEAEKLISVYSTKEGRKIEKIILSGGSANFSGLADYFSKRLRETVIVGNPFSRIKYPPILEPVIKKIGPSLGVAVGLAMREE